MIEKPCSLCGEESPNSFGCNDKIIFLCNEHYEQISHNSELESKVKALEGKIRTRDTWIASLKSDLEVNSKENQQLKEAIEKIKELNNENYTTDEVERGIPQRKIKAILDSLEGKK